MLSDELTAKELKEYLRLTYRDMSVKDLHLHPSTKIPMKDGRIVNFLQVQDIDDKVYSKLNGTIVERYPQSKLPEIIRHKYTHKPLLNDKGKPRLQFSEKPASNSVAVLSTKSLGIPYKYKPTQAGLGYTMRFPDDTFGYYVPAENLHTVNLTALALSSRKGFLKAYYGESLVSYQMGKIFIGVIPFNGRIDYVNTVILGVHDGLDWSNDIKLLKAQLVRMGVIPIPGSLPNLSESISDDTLQYERIEPKSLAEQHTDEKMPIAAVTIADSD